MVENGMLTTGGESNTNNWWRIEYLQLVENRRLITGRESKITVKEVS